MKVWSLSRICPRLRAADRTALCAWCALCPTHGGSPLENTGYTLTLYPKTRCSSDRASLCAPVQQAAAWEEVAATVLASDPEAQASFRRVADAQRRVSEIMVRHWGLRPGRCLGIGYRVTLTLTLETGIRSSPQTALTSECTNERKVL